MNLEHNKLGGDMWSRGCLCLMLAGTMPVVWADCTDVIKLSKTVSTVTQSRSAFESSAATFCNEYKKGAKTAKSANYGISYKLIAASMGTTKASEEEIASKVCSTNDAETSRADAYQQYIESISDNAYKAFEACEKMRSAKIDISISSVLNKEIAISVGNSSSKAAPAQLQVVSSAGATCNWLSDGAKGNVLSVATGTTAFLKCSRPDISQQEAITIGDISDGAGAKLTIPWPALNAAGLPIDLLAQLTKRVDEAVALAKDASTTMSNGVVAFALPSCPAGWGPYTPAYGRFIRGIDPSGSKTDADGVRQLESVQGDSLATHSHSITLPGRAGNKAFVNKPAGWGYDDAQGAPSSADTANAGAEETRPKNVALLYCKRQG